MADELKKAVSLMYKDTERAVELLSQVLETRIKKYGDDAEECAEAYLQYGISLLVQGQASSDVLGQPVPQQTNAEEDSDEEGEEEEGNEGEADRAVPGGAASENDNPNAGNAADASGEAAKDKESEAACDKAGALDPQDEDEFAIAWDMLEMARLIYEKDSTCSHDSEIAEVHMALGDISSEQDRFEEAINEYSTCLSYLDKVVPEDRRRIAEVYFKLCLAQQFTDLPDDALKSCQSALVKLDLAKADIESQAELLDDADEDKLDQLKDEVADLNNVIEDLKDKVEELHLVIRERASMKQALTSAFKLHATAQGQTSGGLEAKQAPCGPVTDLGVVGRGKQRITLAPVSAGPQVSHSDQQPPNAQPKRTLDSLMGGPGGVTAFGFGSVPAEIPEQLAKRLRAESDDTK